MVLKYNVRTNHFLICLLKINMFIQHQFLFSALKKNCVERGTMKVDMILHY